MGEEVGCVTVDVGGWEMVRRWGGGMRWDDMGRVGTGPEDGGGVKYKVSAMGRGPGVRRWECTGEVDGVRICAHGRSL